MIDIGGVKFSIDVQKVVESKKKVFELRQELVEVDRAFGEDIKTQKAWLAELRKSDRGTKELLTGAKTTGEAIKKLDSVTMQYIDKLRLLNKEQKEFAANPSKFLATQQRLPAGASQAYIQNKSAYSQIESARADRASAAQRYLGNFNANKASGFASWNQGLETHRLAAQKALNAEIARQTQLQVTADAAFRKEALSRVATHRKEEAALRKIAEQGEKARMALSKGGTSSGGPKLAAQQIQAALPWYRRLDIAMRSNGDTYHAWWKRFGGIAVGFAIAYRTINALEQGIHQVTSAFTDGLRLMDDYKEGLAVISGMIALTYRGGAGYIDRYNIAHSVMEQTMKSAMRLAPKYKLSIDEITAGFRELAQFGAIVTPDITEESLSTLALIKEISMSTGQTTKQIRQEVQSIFTHTAKQSDQFAMMVKNSMGDVYKQLGDPALSAQEKWVLLAKAVKDFQYAAVEANQTVSSQAGIFKNTISMISLDALEKSDVFAGWVRDLKSLNARLFDAKGNYTDFGKKVLTVFADIWSGIDRAVRATVDFFKLLGNGVTIAKELLSPLGDLPGSIFKAIVAMTALKQMTDMAVYATKLLYKATGISTLINGITSLTLGTATLGISVLAVGTAFGVGIAAGHEFSIALTTIVDSLSEKYGNFFTRLSEEIKILQTTSKIASLTISQGNPLNAFKYGEIQEEIDEYSKMLNKRLDNRTPWTATSSESWQVISERNEKKARVAYKASIQALQNEISSVGTELIPADMRKNFDSFSNNVTKIFGDGKDNLVNSPDTKEYNQALLDSLSGPLRSAGEATAAGERAGKNSESFYTALSNKLFEQAEKAAKMRREFEIAKIEQMLELDAAKKQAQADKDTSSWQDFKLPQVIEVDNAVEQSTERATSILERFYSKSENNFMDWMDNQDASMSSLWESIGQSMVTSFKESLAEMYAAYLNDFLKKILALNTNGGGSEATAGSLLAGLATSVIGGLFGGGTTVGLSSTMAGGSAASAGPYSLMNGSATGSFGSGSVTPSFLGGTNLGTKYPMAAGGIINEPVIGRGLHSGESYSFAERGPERVLSNADSFGKAAQPNVAVNIVNNSKSQVSDKVSTRMDMNGMIIDIILDDYKSGGATYQTFGGK